MTDIALPLQTSIRTDDADEDVSFQVINQDNLPMTVLGERMFKPFGSENQKRKPNGIVYPTRRLDLSSQHVNQNKHLARSNGHLDGPIKLPSNSVNFKHLSSSHGNINQLTKNKSPDDFTKNLDAKLRRLQHEKKKFDQSKKPFITTVKKGKFLEAPEISPPASKTSRIEEEDSSKNNKGIKKQLYAYVSKPMVLSRSPPQNVHRSRCEAAAIAAGLQYTKEVADNDTTDGHKNRKKREAVIPEIVLPEKRVVKERPDNLSQTSHKIDLEDAQTREARANMARRRAIARKKAKLQSSRTDQEPATQIPGSVQLKAVEIQTENYLEASLIKPPVIDMDTQTELESVDRTKDQSFRSAQDEETQITPGDLFDFEEEMQPVLDVLVGKTIESALIEILEEEELAALKEQQRRFLEIRAEEQREAEELMEKHLVDQVRKKNARGASNILEKYLTQLIPPVIEELQSEGVITEKESYSNGSFMPWLIEEVTMELGDILSSGDVLIGIVRDIFNRKTEICNAMNLSEEHEEESEKAETNDMVDEK